MKRTLVRLSVLALVTSTLFGCGNGEDGINGLNGATGATGAQGASGANISVAALETDEWASLKLQGQITGVTINSPPQVTFTLTDLSGNPITGLENNTRQRSTDTMPSYMNFAATIAKLVPGTNGSPSKWVSYIVTSVPTTSSPTSVASRPSTDNTGTLTYNGNGSYTYTFWRDITTVAAVVAASPESSTKENDDLGDLTYDPTLTHRVAIQISGDARGTGSNTADGTGGDPSVLLKTPISIIYDFIPATGLPVSSSDTQREIVSFRSCFECHTKFVGFHGSSPELGLAGVGSSRQDTRLCVLCHTDQRKYGRSEATTTSTGYSGSTYRVGGKSLTDFPTFVHKIHMGEELIKTGYNIAGLEANEIKYPQLITNCVKCHDGSSTATNPTAQGDNWNTVPNQAACGACHDGIDFTTGTGTTLSGLTTGHGNGVPGALADDSQCSTCHTPALVRSVHVAVTPQDLNSSMFAGGTNSYTNSAWIASNWDNLPAGAIKVSYDIKSVSRNSSKQPVIEFRMLQDSVAVPFNTYPSANGEMWDNFMGAPSVYFVFAVPQDGITAPADFNASTSAYLRSLWNGTATTNSSGSSSAGTLTGPDADGYYTATLTGVEIPDSAVMLTGGMGYSYAPKNTMPVTQTNLADYPTADATGSGLTAGMPNKTGGLIVVAPDEQKVATGYTGRRVIVDDARCNKCHKELGAFNNATFHAAQRNNGTTCSWCHTPNRTSAGWSADSTNFVHAIHGSLKRGDSAPFTWHASSTTDGFWKIGYPGVLSNCEACHVPGSYDFSNSTNRAAADNRLYRTAATGTFSSGASATTVFSYSPYVVQDTDYGSGFSYKPVAGELNPTTAAAGTTLVESPTATVCFACHTSSLARSHMEANGGSIYEARSTALTKTEQCLICHDSGRAGDLKKVHSR